MCPLYFVFRKYLYSTASARPGPLTHCCCWGNTCLRCCKWSQLRVTTSNIAGQTYHASQLTECDGNIIGLYCGGPLILRLTLSISPSVCVNKPHQRFKQWNMLRGSCAAAPESLYFSVFPRTLQHHKIPCPMFPSQPQFPGRPMRDQLGLHSANESRGSRQHRYVWHHEQCQHWLLASHGHVHRPLSVFY